MLLLPQQWPKGRMMLPNELEFRMFRSFSLTVAALMLAAPSFAATATCSTADAAKFQSQDTLTATLAAQGLTVKKIKTEGGCYEAYTVDANGAKITLGFNAETLEPVENAEAGESN